MTPEIPSLSAAGLFEGIGRLADVFTKILAAPWGSLDVLWGIVPVYVTLLIGIFYQTGKKVGWGSTVASGFALVWVGLNWGRHSFEILLKHHEQIHALRFSLSFIVTLACIGLGVTAIVLGFRRKAPRTCQLLGHFTFNAYVFITFYPMQSNMIGMEWTLERFAAIALFAPVFWLAIFLFASTRRLKKTKKK